MAHTSICWIVPFALCATVGAQGVADADGANPKRVEEALYKFKRLMPRTQKSIVTKVRAAVDAVEDDYLKSVRHYIEVGRTLSSKSKLKTRQKKTKIEASPGWRLHVPFPVEREYAFGFDKTFTVDPLGKKPSAARRQADMREASLVAMVHGNLPNLDQAVAGILYQLDRESASDDFSRLLETWRNGPESFYHALDRTAGTEQSVFFYDAMLDDFIVSCVPKKHSDYRALRGSLQKSHDALHTSFLSYRQYRAFREAVALSLLLSPGTPLPLSLKRYDDDSKSQFSTRQQLSMLLRAAKQNIATVVSEVAGSAPPLPKTLWDNKYDPFPSFQKLMEDKATIFLKINNSTDKIVGEEYEILTASHRKVAAAACAALLESMTRRKY